MGRWLNCVKYNVTVIFYSAENTRGLDTGLRGYDDIHFLLSMFAFLCFQVSVLWGKLSFEDVVLY